MPTEEKSDGTEAWTADEHEEGIDVFTAEFCPAFGGCATCQAQARLPR